MDKEKKVVHNVVQHLDYGRLNTGFVQVTAKRDVTAKDLHAALDRMLNLHGCPACGLNGIDLIFRRPDFIQDNFADLRGIANVTQRRF